LQYEIVEMQPYTGSEAKVYSIIPKGETETLFEKFVDEYITEFRSEIKDILKTLYQIGNTTGARSSYFKHFEGKPGDFVCALYDLPGKSIRLYCIRFGMDVVILGGGGEKPDGVRAWQDDEKLTKEATQVIAFAEDILKRIDDGDIYWSKDKKELEGNLKNYDNE